MKQRRRSGRARKPARLPLVAAGRAVYGISRLRRRAVARAAADAVR